MKVRRTITLRGAVGAELRTGRYLGDDYTVIPVVMLVEGVIHPANAEFPELVLASEFSKAFAGWNGRPVVLNHPKRNGEFVSAGDPGVLEEYAFGMLFNASVTDTRLLAEAWVLPRRAEAVGPKAVRVLEMAREGTSVEISTGTLVEVELLAGVYEPTGQSYGGIWRGLVPDHLAMLEEGAIGACSVEMGCGAPRAAVAYRVTDAGLAPLLTQEGTDMPNEPATPPPASAEQPPAPPAPPAQPRTLRERLKALLSIPSPKADGAEDSTGVALAVAHLMRSDATDVDTRSALDRALRSTEPGYLWIDVVDPDEKTVVYMVAPEDRMVIYRRSYKTAEDGETSLADDREEVKPVTHYEPVKAAEAGCGCGGRKQEPSHPAPAAAGENVMPDKKTRVQALIDSKRNAYGEAQRASLEALEEPALKAIEDLDATLPEPQAAQPPSPPAPPAPPVTASTKTAEQIEAEYLAGAPESIRTLVAEKKAADAAEKTALVTHLTAAQKQFSQAQLNAKTNEELRALAEMLAAASGQPVIETADYSGRALPRAAAENNAPPDGYAIALAARKGATSPRKES